ncbi:hypothetical protein LG290_08020 [Halomonas sediminis]
MTGSTHQGGHGHAGHMPSPRWVAYWWRSSTARLARRPAEEDCSFGWYRAEIIEALVNGSFLLGLVWKESRGDLNVKGALWHII